MADFDIKSCSRKCAITDQEIGRGERYFSVVTLDDDGQLVRHDYSEAAWNGPPEECLGWWKSEVPSLEEGRVYWAPNDVLYAYFDEIMKAGKEPAKLYVMTILLIRRRLMKLDESRQADPTRLRVTSPRHESVLEIPVVELTPDQIQELQNELGEHLFTNRVQEKSDEGTS